MPEEPKTTRTHHVGQFDDSIIPLSAGTFRDMVEHCPDLISLHAPSGVYQYASPAAYTLLGFRPNELEGHNAYEFYHPEDLAEIQQVHDAVLERIETQTVRYRMLNFHGEYVWVETTSRTMRDPHTGEAERIISTTRRARGDEQREVGVIVHEGKAAARRERQERDAVKAGKGSRPRSKVSGK